MKLHMDHDLTRPIFQVQPGAQSALLPVALEGLLLEGAAFDRVGCLLLESAKQSNLVSALPTLTISWAPANQKTDFGGSFVMPGGGAGGGRSNVGIPIYVSLTREKILGTVSVPTDNPRARIFNSSAMFLSET